MRPVIFMSLILMSSLLQAAMIQNDQQLLAEVQRVTEEQNQSRRNHAFQELMSSLLESKHAIADLPEEDYQAHQGIYLKVIELREYLSNIKTDAQGNCIVSATQQPFAQSPLLRQELQASSIRGIFSHIYNRLCR